METPRLDSGVYLAGAITGLTYGESIGWRLEAAERLKDLGYTVYSPMREKLHLKEVFADQAIPHTSAAFRDPFQRDALDIRRSDFLLVNLVEAPQVGPSVGTVAELGFAYGLGKHVVAFDERLGSESDKGSHHTHPFILGMVNELVPSLDEALALFAEFRPL